MTQRSGGFAEPAPEDGWEWDDFAMGDFESGEDDRI